MPRLHLQAEKSSSRHCHVPRTAVATSRINLRFGWVLVWSISMVSSFDESISSPFATQDFDASVLLREGGRGRGSTSHCASPACELVTEIPQKLYTCRTLTKKPRLKELPWNRKRAQVIHSTCFSRALRSHVQSARETSSGLAPGSVRYSVRSCVWLDLVDPRRSPSQQIQIGADQL